jgi:hypothetical protein
MQTNNIPNATSQVINWVDELNSSSQSHYSEDVAAWAHSLLDAARSQGYSASLTSMGSGGCGVPVLNVGDKSIPLGAIRYGEFQKYGLEAGKWIACQMNGTVYDLSPEARSLSHREQLYALESSIPFAQNQGGPEQIQAFVDQLKAFWATQSPSSPAACSEPVVLPLAQSPVLPAAPATPDTPATWGDDLNAAAQSGYAEHVGAWSQSLLDAAQSMGYEASLTRMGAGAHELTVGETVILLGAIRYGEFQKYGLEPAPWLDSVLNGTPYPLSPEARDLSQREQLYALETSKAFAQNEGGPDQIQAFIDQLKAFWAAQPGQNA